MPSMHTTVEINQQMVRGKIKIINFNKQLYINILIVTKNVV